MGRRLPDILAQVIGAALVVSPASIRPDLSGLVNEVRLGSLAKAPGGRFQVVRDVRLALGVAITGRP